MPNPAVVDFEDEDGQDDDRAMQDACRNLERFEWQPEDLPFYFNQIEAKMAAAGVKKNYTKFQVLSTILPRKVQDQVKPLLRLKASDFPNGDAYKKLKAEVLRIFGPKPKRAVERALGRVLSGKPSELARELVNDICKKQLDGCECCPAVIEALWHRHLPPNVRAGIAQYSLSKATFNQVLDLADDIFESSAPPPSVSAFTTVRSANLDETQPAIPYAAPEVAGVSRGRGGRGGRGNRGGGRGRGRGGSAPANNANSNQSSGGQSGGQATGGQRHKGTKHPDLPDGVWQGCAMHFRWGRQAHFCSEPSTCPWKNVYTPKSNNK